MIRPVKRRPRLSTFAIALGLSALAGPLLQSDAHAQWVTTYEQFYLQASHNWKFRDRYQAADRLFNAFDYGHAILYETLWSRPKAPVSELEEKRYDFLTKKVLIEPPSLPLEESAIEINYARLAPEAKMMFDWAHLLHRQIYDVWADERIPIERKDTEIARLIAYYKTRPDLAFSSRPKSMVLMQEQPYSLAFRLRYPKFNGLIWAYHWLQVGLYEPLMTGRTPEQRQAGVRATVARFWQMLENPTATMPYQMPMTAAVAPSFASRYPEAAIIFDNLHSMHDVVSDVLANDSVPRNRKRAEIILAGRRFRDDTSYVMPVEAWRTMAREMGVENMGGPAVGFLPALPTPTVTYGAVMVHDELTGKMIGMKYGQMTGEHGAMQHEAVAGGDSAKMAAMDHSPMNTPGVRDSTMASMTELHARMMADPVMRERMMADTVMRRLMTEMMDSMPAAGAANPHAGHDTPAKPPATAPAVRKPATRKPAPAKKDSVPVMDHSKMPGMRKP